MYNLTIFVILKTDKSKWTGLTTTSWNSRINRAHNGNVNDARVCVHATVAANEGMTVFEKDATKLTTEHLLVSTNLPEELLTNVEIVINDQPLYGKIQVTEQSCDARTHKACLLLVFVILFMQ